MLQCHQTAMAGAALLRLGLLYRMLRVGELLALVALVSWSSLYVPSAVAAVLRLAGSLLLNARFVFVLGNAIVLLLFALSRHEHDLSPSSGSSTSSDQDQPAAASAATTTTPQQQQQQQQQQLASSSSSSSSVPPPPPPVAASFPPFTEPTTTTSITLPSSDAVTTGTSSVAMTPPPAMQEEEALLLRRRRDKVLLFEDKQQQQQVHKQARAPRRSRSEKMGSRRRAASPELRRCESENGRGRRRSSVTARDAEACCWGREDADEFRRQVEAFIARQTRFHREESLRVRGGHHWHCEAAPAITAALAVVE